MRFAVGLSVISMLLSVVAKPARAEDGKAPQHPKQRYVVFCRWFDEKDCYYVPGIRTVAHGEKVRIHPSSPIIDVTLTAGPQPGGASADIAVGKAEAHERHIAPFVKFNDTLVIRLGAKRAGGATPRVEILVGAGDVIRWDWNWDVKRDQRSPVEADREAVFRAITATGTARVSSQAHSRLETLIGDKAYDNVQAGIECLLSSAELAYLYSYLPHRSGPFDLLGVSWPLLEKWNSTHAVERAFFGQVSHYTVELWDSPVLPMNEELLGRLRDTSNIDVVIHAKHDPLLRPNAEKLCRFQSIVWDKDLKAWGEVDGKPVLWSAVEQHTAETMKSHTERIKTVSANWQQAESAIPAFKRLPHLEQVLLNVAEKSEESKARRTLEAMKKALPNAEVHLVCYFAESQPGNTLHKTQNAQSNRKAAPANVKKPAGEVNMGIVTRIIMQDEEEERVGVLPVE
jgi:hypothetical protein